MKEECGKFGAILEMKIPRPVGGSRQSAGVGKIFVKYDTTEATTTALRALAGRKFADRTVVATFFPEVKLSPISPHDHMIGIRQVEYTNMIQGKLRCRGVVNMMTA